MNWIEWDTPEDISEDVSGDSSEDMSGDASEDMSGDTSEDITSDINAKISADINADKIGACFLKTCLQGKGWVICVCRQNRRIIFVIWNLMTALTFNSLNKEKRKMTF